MGAHKEEFRQIRGTCRLVNIQKAKNKDANQLCSNCKADQHIWFRSINSTTPLLLKPEITRI